MTPRRIVVGISGASGAVLAVRLLQALQQQPQVETHLVVSADGKLTLQHEKKRRQPLNLGRVNLQIQGKPILSLIQTTAVVAVLRPLRQIQPPAIA